MATAMPSSGSFATAEAERTVLIAGDELARVDSLVSSLRRASISVRRAVGAQPAAKLIQETRYDLIVVVLPLASAHQLLRAIRAEGSPCRRTAIVLLADESLAPEQLFQLGPMVNKVLAAESPPEDVRSTAAMLLNTAPRVDVQGTARLHLGSGDVRTARLENVSSTGMLLVGSEPPAVGAVFGFELTIASMSAPIRGRANVVRHTARREAGEHGIAVAFLSLGGEGAEQLESLIFQERAAAAAKDWRSGVAAGTGVIQIRDSDELEMRKEELAELTPYLEGVLRQGLIPRVKAAEWYATAAEMGLESLRAFSAILEAVQGGRSKRFDVSQQLTDLTEVSGNLERFGVLGQELEVRVQILLDMRLSLERLLRALALTGAVAEADTSGRGSGSRPRGLVFELALEIQRLLRSRRNLRQIPGELKELRHPRYLFARRALKRRIDEICNAHSTWIAELGIDREMLRSGRGRKRATSAVMHEIKKLDQRLANVHQMTYSGRFRSYVSGDMEADFEEKKFTPIVVAALAAGSEFLLRAYSCYKHALELTRVEPKILDRVAGLAAAVAAAEQKLTDERAAR